MSRVIKAFEPTFSVGDCKFKKAPLIFKLVDLLAIKPLPVLSTAQGLIVHHNIYRPRQSASGPGDLRLAILAITCCNSASVIGVSNRSLSDPLRYDQNRQLPHEVLHHNFHSFFLRSVQVLIIIIIVPKGLYYF